MNAKLFGSPQSFAAAAAAAAMISLPSPGHAQTTFTDNASNYSSYTTGSGAGVAGFGAFNVATIGPSAGTFVASASQSEGGNGTPAPSTIDTSGNSFGTYANNGATSTVDVTRSFAVPTQSSGLNIAGDSFSLNFVTGYNDGANGTGNSGVSLLTSTGTVGTFQYVSNDQYLFNGQLVTKADTTKQDYTNGAFSLNYLLTSPTAYTLNVSGPFSFTGTGTLTSPVTGFQVQQQNSGGGDPAHNAYFNNLSLTAANAPSSAAPEPSQTAALALVVLGIGGLLLRRRLNTSPA